MNSLKPKIIINAVGIAFLSTNSAFANLVMDGGFETPGAVEPYQTIYTSGNIGAWQVSGGSVDLISTYWQPKEGSESLDAAGLSNGTIQQSITIATAGTYLLTFDMSGNPDGLPNEKKLDVSFGGGTPAEFSYNIATMQNSRANMKWQQMSWLVNLTAGETVLKIQDVSEPAGNPSFPNTTPWGAAIDNVSLVAVPEPTTMIAGMLLLLPFGASTLRIVRKSTAA